MIQTKKALAFAAAFTTALAGTAIALDQDVEADAEFRAAITMTVNSDIDFTTGSGVIEYGSPTGSDLVTLATDGDITVTGSEFTAPATGQVGDVTFAGDGASSVDITCTATATLAETGTGTTVTMQNIEFAVDTGVATGLANACAGLGAGAVSHTLDGTDALLIGGELVGAATITDAVYSTTNTGDGGVPATFRVVYN